MTRPIAFVNARLLDPAIGYDGPGTVLVEGSVIVGVGSDLVADAGPEVVQTIDCQGLCIAPGLVDMRAGVCEPGLEHKETIDTACRAAIAGGITTLACLPDADPTIDDVAGIEFIARRARETKLAKVFPFSALTKDRAGKTLVEMRLLEQAGAIGFTDSTHTVANALVLQRALSYARAFETLVVQHPQEPVLSDGGMMNAGEKATRLGLAGIHPLAEVIQVERDIRLTEMTGGKLHFANISTGAAVEAIRQAKRRQIPITCDTAPPYFSLTEEDVENYRTYAKLSPPLRDEMDRRAVVDGIVDGTIDCIASDHRPEDQDSKRLPFAQAAFGAVGLETLLPISLKLYHAGRLSLLQVIEKLTINPARLLSLPVGRLRPGAQADLIVFDPDTAWKIDPTLLNSKSKNTPFDGHPVLGRVLMTMVDGRFVHELSGKSP